MDMADFSSPLYRVLLHYSHLFRTKFCQFKFHLHSNFIPWTSFESWYLYLFRFIFCFFCFFSSSSVFRFIFSFFVLKMFITNYWVIHCNQSRLYTFSIKWLTLCIIYSNLRSLASINTNISINRRNELLLYQFNHPDE